MQIKQLMTKEIIAVTPETPVSIVADILTQKRIHGIPVIKDKKLFGIITESDFFIKNLPSGNLSTYIDLLKKLEQDDKLNAKQQEDIAKLKNAKASDVMTKECITVNEEMETEELTKLFSEQRLFTIPVVNNSGEVTGIITQADIIKMMMSINF